MKSTWTKAILAVLGAGLLGLTGCDRFMRAVGLRTDETVVDSVNETGEPIGTQALTSNPEGGGSNLLVNGDAGIQLTLPSTWSEASQLHNSAELQAADPNQQLYMVVVAEEIDALLRLGLEENAENYRALLASQLQSVESQTPTDVAFIGDNFAKQYEIRGRLADNTPVVYLHTTVVTEDRYYQIVGWTTPEQYNAYQSELQNITETFEEIES